MALMCSRSLSRSFSRITDVSVVSVLAERWKQERQSSCGQSLLPPNPADPANHGPSTLLHGGSTRRTTHCPDVIHMFEQTLLAVLLSSPLSLAVVVVEEVL